MFLYDLLLLGFVGGVYLVFNNIIFSSIQIQGNLDNLSNEKYLNNLGTSIFKTATSSASGGINTISNLLNSIVSNYRLIGFALVISVFIQLWVLNGPAILATIDHNEIEYGLPFYESIILPVIKFINTIYNFSIGYLNLISSTGSIFIGTSITLGYDCTKQNYKYSFIKATDSLDALAISTVKFTLSLGADDFDMYTPTLEFTEFIASFNNVTECECKDLSFLSGFLLQSISDPSVAITVDGLINTLISAIRLLWDTFKLLITSGLTANSCQNYSSQSQINQCFIKRAPLFDQIGDKLCETTLGVSLFIDSTVNKALSLILDDSISIPRLSPFLSNTTCSVITITSQVLNTVSHIDVFYPSSGYSNIYYLNYIKIDKVMGYAYNSTNGIALIGTDVGVDEIEDIFEISAISINVSINTLNSVFRTVRVLITEPENILSRVRDNTTQINLIEKDLYNLSNSIDELVSNLNGPLGTMFKEFVDMYIKLFRLFIDLLSNADNFSDYLTNSGFYNNVDALLYQMDTFAISAGNIIKQFDTSDGNRCPLRNPETQHNADPIQNIEILCCLGALVQSSIEVFVSFLRLFIITILQLIQGTSPNIVFGSNGVGNLNTDFLVKVQFVINSASCLFPSLLDYLPNQGQCPSGNGSTLSQTTYNYLVGLFSLILSPIKIFSNMIGYIIVWSNGGTVSYCTVLRMLYNNSFGKLAIIIYDFIGVLSCLVPNYQANNIFSTIGFFALNFFGPNARFANDLCSVLEYIFNAFQYVYGLFTNPQGFIIALFDDLEDSIKKYIIEPLLTTINDIKKSIKYLQDALQDVYATINGIILEITLDYAVVSGAFNCIFDVVGNFFSQLGSCIASVGSDCDFNQPCSFKKRDDLLSTHSMKKKIGVFYKDDNRIGHPYKIQEILDVNQKRDFSDDIRITFFNYDMDDPKSPCYNQIMAARYYNGTNLQYILANDAGNCIRSVGITRLMDMIFLLNFNASMKSLVDPLIFYSVDIQNQFLYNFTIFAPIFTSYVNIFLKDTVDYTGSVLPNQTVYVPTSWPEYAAENGINDALSIQMGIIGQLILTGVKNNEANGSFNILSSIIGFSYKIWNFATDILTYFGPNQTNQDKRSFMERNVDPFYDAVPVIKTLITNVSKLIEKNENNHPLYSLYYHTKNHTIKMINKLLETNDTIKIQNRRIFSRVAQKIIWRWNMHIEGANIGDELYKIDNEKYFGSKYRAGQYKPINRFIDGKLSELKKEMNNETIDKRDNSDIPEYVDLCVDGYCFECEILDQIIDKFIYLLLLTNNRTTSLKPENDFIFPEQYHNIDNDTLNISYIFPNLEKKDSLYTSNGMFSEGNIAIHILNKITQIKYNIDWFYVKDYIAHFFNNQDNNSADSILFWVEFSLHCDYVTMPKCNLYRHGFGVFTAAYIYFTAFVLLLLFYYIATGGFSTLIFIGGLLFSFYGIIILGYFISPWCLVPKFPLGLPILPDCLLDDIYRGFQYLDTPCINWNNILPSITTNICPNQSNDFNRPFLDWTEYPYFFTTGLRNVFFMLEYYAPSVNYFFKTTTIFPLNSLREFSPIGTAMDFDFGPNGIDDSWISANKATLPAMIPTVALAGSGLLGSYLFLYLTITLLSNILSILLSGLVLSTSVFANLFNVNDRTKIKMNDNETNFLYKEKNE